MEENVVVQLWVGQLSTINAAFHSCVANLCIDVMQQRDVYANWIMYSPPPQVVNGVQIDELVVSRTKYCERRRVPERWIFGGYDTTMEGRKASCKKLKISQPAS